jgi:hypothetical protein
LPLNLINTAALRAKHGVLCKAAGEALPFDVVLGSIESRGLTLAAEPDLTLLSMYTDMLDAYHMLEVAVQRGAGLQEA